MDNDHLPEKIDVIRRHLMGSITGAFIAYEPAQAGEMHCFRVDAGRGSKLVGFTWEFLADTDLQALEQLLKDSEIAVRLALTQHKALLVSHAGVQEMENLP
jgi:hypothetical protein